MQAEMLIKVVDIFEQQLESVIKHYQLDESIADGDTSNLTDIEKEVLSKAQKYETMEELLNDISTGNGLNVKVREFQKSLLEIINKSKNSKEAQKLAKGLSGASYMIQEMYSIIQEEEDDDLPADDSNPEGSEIEGEEGVDILPDEQETELGGNEEVDRNKEYLVDLTSLLMNAFKLKPSDEVIALLSSKIWRTMKPYKKIAWVRNLLERNKDEIISESFYNKIMFLEDIYLEDEDDESPEFGGVDPLEGLSVDETLQGDLVTLISKALKENPHSHIDDSIKKLPSVVNESNYELVISIIEGAMF